MKRRMPFMFDDQVLDGLAKVSLFALVGYSSFLKGLSRSGKEVPKEREGSSDDSAEKKGGCNRRAGGMKQYSVTIYAGGQTFLCKLDAASPKEAAADAIRQLPAYCDARHITVHVLEVVENV